VYPEAAGPQPQELAVDASSLDGDEVLAEPLTLQDKVAGQHSAVHAFHHHIPHAGVHRGGSGAGIIWLLVVLHVAFVGYWTWVWWTSRSKQREEKKIRSSVPQKVNCVYDWTPVLPQIPNIQLASKSAQH
jgi:hypothetical protein